MAKSRAKSRPPKRKGQAWKRTKKGFSTANRWRKTARSGASKLWGLGTLTACKECGVPMLKLHEREHMATHGVFEDGDRLKPITKTQRAALGGRNQPPPDPAPRTPSRSKQQAQRGGGRPVAPKTAPPAQNGGGQKTGGAGGNGRPDPRSFAANTPAGAMLHGIRAWCEYRPTTIEDLEAHLHGGALVFEMACDMFQQFGQEAMIAKRVHPACAEPLRILGFEMANLAVWFRTSVLRVEQIYEQILFYRRNQTYQPNPDFFNQVG